MKSRYGVLWIAFFLALSAMPLNAQTETKLPLRTIRLDAMGSAKAKPDLAQIAVGVVSEADNAKAALDQNSQSMAKIIAGLKDSGIAETDIQTVDFSVRPRLEISKDNKPPVINGYRVVNSVRILVRNLDRLGQTLERVAELGSNEMGGISFSINDAAQLLDEARKRAIENARHKAELYAEAAGVALGRVLTIDEQTVTPWRPQNYAVARMDAKAADVPIQPGEGELQVTISVMWELVDKT